MRYNYDFTDECMRDDMREKVCRTHFCSKKLVVRDVEGGIILPQKTFPGDKIRGGVVNSEGEFISNTGFHVGKEGKYDYDSSQLKVFHCKAIYLGFFNPVWGHCITDNLKLLWFVLTDDFRQLTSQGDVELVYSCCPDFKFSGNFKIILSFLGINVEKLHRIDSLTQFDKLYIPEACFFANTYGERFYTKELVDVIDRITSYAHDGPAYEKVYLTRTKLPGGLRDLGEKDIEKCFRKLGYKILAPERLSLMEQLSVIKHCKVLATTEGSISHNAIFMHEGAELVVVRKVPFINEYQLAINEMRNLDVTYIDAHLSIFANVDTPAAGPFFLYVNDNMARFCHNKVTSSFHLTAFKKYVSICMMLPNFDRRIKFPDYYYRKLSEETERLKSSYRDRLRRIPFLNETTRNKIIELGKKLIARG